MAKIDKEVLKKNQFWIGIGVFVLIWLVAIIMVKAGSDDAKKKAWEKAKNDIEGARKAGPKTEAYQKPWNKYGKTFSDHKDTIWKQAWEQQASMFTWPEGMPFVPYYPENRFTAEDKDGKYDERLDLNNRERFRTDYDRQFDGWEAYVSPVTFAGGFATVFPKQKWNARTAPTREEIWLAQEDFWVRKEMLVMVKTALDYVAFFHEVPLDKDKADEDKKDKKDDKADKDDKAGKDVKDKAEKKDGKEKDKAEKDVEKAKKIVGRRKFRNANWELDLKFVEAEKGSGWDISADSTIKNINVTHKTQTLANPQTNKGLPFRLWQEGAQYEMRIAGEPQAYDKETRLGKNYSVQPVNLKKPFYVEQLLDKDISPIRRIERLEVGFHSHRTVNAGLKIREDLKNLDPEPAAEGETGTGTGTGTGATGSPSPGGPAAGGPAAGGPGGMTGGSAGGKPGAPGSGTTSGSGDAAKPEITRVNEIKRARYLQVTPQCRHLPIGMRLVVDQAHIHDVLAAVANSRLRVQITQVSFHADVKPDTDTGATSGSTPGPGPGRPTVAGAGRPPMGLGAVMPGIGGSSAGGPKGGGIRPGGQTIGPGGRGSMSGPPRGMGGPTMSSAIMAGRPIGGPADMGMPRPPGGTGGTTGTTPKPRVHDTARLVELSIYGIASLYERFPPRKKPETTTGGQPGQPVTPAGAPKK